MLSNRGEEHVRTVVLLAGLGLILLVVVALSMLPATLVVKSDRESYPAGSSAHIEVIVTYGPNFLRGPVTMPSMNYKVVITGPSGPVVAMQTSVHTKGPVTISPNTTQKVAEFDWNFKDASGKTVEPGTYVIAVNLIDYPISGQASIQLQS
jgi:carbon starvation protein CstA